MEHVLKDVKANAADTCGGHGTVLMLQDTEIGAVTRGPCSVALAWKADLMEVFQASM